MKTKLTTSVSRLGVFVIVSIALIFALAPLVWMINISFSQPEDAIKLPPVLFKDPTLQNYRDVLLGNGDSVVRGITSTKDFPKLLLNSTIISLTSTFISLALGVPGAYALSKLKLKRKKEISFFVLSTRFIPPIVIVIPIFIAFQRLGLMDTLQGLIIVYSFVNISLVVWMMKGYFDDVPTELIESARMDGCTQYGALQKIVIPTTRQGIAATAILVLINSWNEFLFAVLFASVHAKTAPLGAMGFVTIRDVAWSNMAAAGIIITLPVLVFTLLVQKNLVQGLTAGAVKG